MAYAYDSSVDKGYFLPTTLRVAGGMELSIDYNHSIAFSLELSKYLVPTPPVQEKDEEGRMIIISGMDDNVSVPVGMIQSFYDGGGGLSEELRKIMTGAGVEYNYADFFKVRGGFYYDPKNTLHRYATLGLGIAYSMFTVDLSYLIPTVSGFNNPLANTIHITFGVNIGQRLLNR
jgi:hypothetical protein